MKYWVELGIKQLEKGEKLQILGIFRSCVPVHLECVPVHIECVPVHPSRTKCVSVHVRGVPIHHVLLSQF